MFRAGPVFEILPKVVVFVTVVSGGLKLARLKALNISAWKRKRNRSVSRNCLRIEKSHRIKFGPTTFPTPLVPRRVSGAVANAAGLIQPSGPGFDNSIGPPR